MTPDDLSERLWQFAARVGKVVDALPNRIAAAAQSHRRPSQFEIFIYQFSIFNSIPPLPEHSWIKETWRDKDPRVPVVTPAMEQEIEN